MNVRDHTWSRNERGYVLLVLLLFVSLLSIGLLTMIEGIEFQIKRDREEELIHRGLEYSRAVRKYVKKFGRYPNSMEALEKSNNVRFLRKRYKDPITGKDFKVLHYGDLETFNATRSSVPAASSDSARLVALSAQANTALLPESQQPTDAGDAQGIPTNEPIDAAQPNQTTSSNGHAATHQPPEVSETSGVAEDTGGPAVIGVASYSKSKSIRVFNKKDRYYQWQFVYDPSTDVGVMVGPNQPLPKGAVNAEQPQGQQGPMQDLGLNRAQK